MGRAKLNLLIAQFGKCKEDCLDAMKQKENEQVWFVLSRSRFFAEKFDECNKYIDQGLKKYPDSVKLQDLKVKCMVELQKELDTVRQITLINQGKDDEKMKVYRALRANKIKLGKVVHHLP
jgi:CHASE3 domain sensor protein